MMQIHETVYRHNRIIVRQIHPRAFYRRPRGFWYWLRDKLWALRAMLGGGA